MSKKPEPYSASRPHKPEAWDGIEAVSFSDRKDLVLANKRVASWYRDSLQIVKIIYDRAYDFLYKKLKEDGEEIRLPIDIRRVAEKCNFAISSEDLSDLEISDRFSPVAQLQMREKLSENQEIAGTILLANYLSETSARFSIAHELGHYVLREYSPIGLSYMMEACPGLYPLADTDELLADLFAYSLLLPYPSFLKLKEEYEKKDSRWPIDFSDWIAFLQERTQMPEYHVVLAYQGIKQYHLAQKLECVQQKTPPYLKKLIARLLDQELTKDQIIEALRYEHPEQLECVQEAVEVIQDQLSCGVPFDEDNSAETEFPSDWLKTIIENLYQQGVSDSIISSFKELNPELISQYVETEKVENTDA